jgi:ribosomal protein S18 acetylase RimI-like enzyme
MNLEIRNVIKSDLSHLKTVLDSIELFPADLLEEMIADYFNNSNSTDLWFTVIVEETPVAIAYCAPEKLTDGTYNLYAIGIKKDLQGQGLGSKMMEYIEDQLKLSAQRILIVETSSSDDFKLTRKFYENLDYTKEAVIRDFWEDGDDKVIYWKKLK